ncbi:hypothetical protein [Thalassospira profundimaris]|nr:hypothetical protein [Thalassospira profundimaris]
MTRKTAKFVFWLIVICASVSVLYEVMFGYEGATGEVDWIEAGYSIVSDVLMLAAIYAYAYGKRWFGYVPVVLIMINTFAAGVYAVLSLLIRDGEFMTESQIVFLVLLTAVVYGVILTAQNSLRKEMRYDSASII